MTVLTTKKFATHEKTKGKPAITLPCKHAKNVLMQEKSVKWPSLPALSIAKKVTRKQ